MEKHFRFLAVAAVIILSALLIYYPSQAQSPVKLTILHINDFHGHLLPFVDKSVRKDGSIGGAAYLAAQIQKERGKNPDGTLLLSAGDMFQGSPISNLFQGNPVMEVMNEIGFDAMALGNHEFDWGMDILAGWQKKAGFPFLSANIRDADGKLLPGVKPYVLFNRKGVSIAVIGVTTTDTAHSTKMDNVKGLAFIDPEKILPNIISEVRAKGAKLIVVLSHLGLDADKSLARATTGIGIIVGGHSHTAVELPVYLGDTVIVQAGCYGIYLGVLDLEVDPASGRVISYTKQAELKTITAGPRIPFNQNVAAIVERYDEKIRAEFSKVIGETAVDLKRSDFSESNVGNLICDAVRHATGVDVAFINGGSIRADIPSGRITQEQAFTILPFDNIVVTMDITGKQIIDILEQSATKKSRIMQVSGLKVVYNMTNPEGHRVSGVTVGNAPLVREKTYRIAANDFLAAGGDQFDTFKDGQRLLYGDPLRDIFVSYLNKFSPVSPGIEGRIKGTSP